MRVAEQRNELVPNDLDDLLGRRQALQHRLIGSAIPHAVDKSLDDLEVDVGFEERQADFS